jgi:hypothetical protein
MQDHDPVTEIPAYLPNRLSLVGIIGDGHRRIKRFIEGVDKQPRRQIDIRPLLLIF